MFNFQNIMISLVAILLMTVSISEMNAQSVPTIDSVRVDSVKVFGNSGVVFFKYYNAQGAGSFSYRANFGSTGNVNANSGHVKSVPAGTSTDTIWCHLPGGFVSGQNYDFKVVFFSPTYAESNVVTSTATSGPPPTCAVSASANTTLICLGGSATLTATGTAGMSYSWTPSTWLSSPFGAVVTANPISTTTYTVVGVDLNGCSDTATVVVNVNTTGVPNLVVSPDTTVCLGDTIVLRASGGVSYQWSNGSNADSIVVSPQWNATYTVTATGSSACVVSKEVKVGVVNINPVLSTSRDSVCLNGISNISLTASISGGSWSGNVFANMFDHASAGVGRHTVVYTVTSGGCVGKDSVYITVLDTPRVDNWSYDQFGNLILYGSFPYPMIISVNSTVYHPSAQNSGKAVFSNLSLSEGELVIVRSQGGGDCFSLFYLITTTTSAEMVRDYIIFYPNPVRETLNINSLNGETFSIYNLHGQQVYEGADTQISVSEWPAGLYIVRVGNSNRSYKILKE